METIPSFLIPIKKVFDDYHREVNRINASANGSKVILVFFKEKDPSNASVRRRQYITFTRPKKSASVMTRSRT